jgi:hypothetical protein
VTHTFRALPLLWLGLTAPHVPQLELLGFVGIFGYLAVPQEELRRVYPYNDSSDSSAGLKY